MSEVNPLQVPPYDEKKFLLALLEDYSSKRGYEVRHLPNHIFDAVGLSQGSFVNKYLPELLATKETANRPRAYHWFEEARARGHVETESPKLLYRFTKLGYETAREYENHCEDNSGSSGKRRSSFMTSLHF